MSDKCDDALENLYLYLDGELKPHMAEDVRVHLEDCPPCGDAFSFEQRLKMVVRTRLQEDVPAELLIRLKQVIRSEVDPHGV